LICNVNKRGFIMNCQIMEESVDRVVLMLEGDLTVQTACELRDVIVQAQETGRHLGLNLEKVTGADVSCLQVFCSAHRSLAKSDRRLTFTGPLPESFARVIRQAGFNRERGCALDVHHTCLWCTGGGNP
jgi:anti-anti-sigma factor